MYIYIYIYTSQRFSCCSAILDTSDARTTKEAKTKKGRTTKKARTTKDCHRILPSLRTRHRDGGGCTDHGQDGTPGLKHYNGKKNWANEKLGQ